MTAERTIDSMAREYAARRELRALRSYADLEHERDERRPWPIHVQPSLIDLVHEHGHCGQ